MWLAWTSQYDGTYWARSWMKPWPPIARRDLNVDTAYRLNRLVRARKRLDQTAELDLRR
jgi:hypothetical protein